MDVSNVKLEIVEEAGSGHILLEGPHWDAETQSLYFVDILKFSLFRLDYQENKVYQAFIGKYRTCSDVNDS